jgi:hypothetical protein
MTKDEIQERIDLLMQARAQAEANFNLIVGRIQENQFLLESLEKKESESEQSEAHDS